MMKKISFYSLLGTFFSGLFFLGLINTIRAQLIENLIVETYYIANTDDAASASGGGLTEGVTTYRVYLDLCEGCELTKLFADNEHPIFIAATQPFFNSPVGVTFGHNLNAALFPVFDSAPLDSYLSFGAASTGHWAILKEDDPDGSIWSSRTPPAALTNSNIEIPLTENDGLINSGSSSTVPGGWFQPADVSAISAVFGNSNSQETAYSTNDIQIISTAGVSGQNNENLVLLGQFTTAGELSFSLNVEIRPPGGAENGNNDVKIYSDPQDPAFIFSPYLSYPPSCGCTDPNFLEYDEGATCDDGSCLTEIVFGCMNTEACNFDPFANYDIPELCCFVDSCQGLDVSILCPSLNVNGFDETMGINVFPNPAGNRLYVDRSGMKGPLKILIYDVSGRLISMQPDFNPAESIVPIEIDFLNSGFYLLVIEGESTTQALKFQKLP